MWPKGFRLLHLVAAAVVVGLGYKLVGNFLPPIAMEPLPSFTELCEVDFGNPYASAENSNSIAVGEVWEKHIDISKAGIALDSEEAKFDFMLLNPKVTWRDPNGQSKTNPGFYDGNQTLKFRSRLDIPGTWRYSITINKNEVDASEIIVSNLTPEKPPLLPIKIDPNNSAAFVTGSEPFFWFGGKWFAAQNMAPCSIWQFRNLRSSQQRTSDEEYIRYLDYLVETKHNSILLKIAQFPLMGDGISWDTLWLNRIEWGLRQALDRGIYVQINLFDTWSRDARYKVVNNTSGERHVFNAWNPSTEDLRLIRNYLTTLIARFSAYPNVVWELGNEMEHHPNCGNCFVEQANKHYLPWIRQLDSSKHLIGLSEDIWLNADVDIGFLHQTRTIDFHDIPKDTRPTVLNELVFSDDTDPLWRDRTMRDNSARLAFRRTFWRSLMLGVSGSFEATWLNVQKELNSSAKNVMEDHALLATFMSQENLNSNDRESLGRLPSFSVYYETYGTRLPGGTHVFYLLSDDRETKLNDWRVEYRLKDAPYGDYEIEWFDPVTGEYFNPDTISFDQGDREKKVKTKIEHSAYDVVMIMRPIQKNPLP